MRKRSSCLTAFPVVTLQVGATIPSLKLLTDAEAHSQMICLRAPT